MQLEVVGVCVSLALAAVPCAHAYTRPPKAAPAVTSEASPTDEAATVSSPAASPTTSEVETPTSPFEPTPGCPYGRHACAFNRNLDNVERKVHETNEGYKKGEMFKTQQEPEAQDDTPKKTKYGTKALKNLALVPVYATRAITWPIIILADFLIKEHVVRNVVDVVSNDARTLWIYPTVELGFGSGFGGGVGVRHYNLFNQGIHFNARYVVHVNMDQEAEVSIGTPELFRAWEKPLAFNIAVNVIHHNNDSFYGVGADTPQSVSGNYAHDEVQAGGFFGYTPIEHFLIDGHLYFVWDQSGTAQSTPYVQDVFPASELVAFQKGLFYIVPGLGLTYDTRDSVNPQRGGFYNVSFSHFMGTGVNDFHYNQFDLVASHFFNFWRPRHVVALRTAWRMQENTDNGVPFYRLSTLGVNSPLRGFNAGRFRDRGSAVFNVEYRYPVWDYLDGEIFFDTGRVFHGITDFSFKYFKYSAGAGFSLRTADYFLMRVEAAYGGEGVKFLFQTSRAF